MTVLNLPSYHYRQVEAQSKWKQWYREQLMIVPAPFPTLLPSGRVVGDWLMELGIQPGEKCRFAVAFCFFQ